MKLFSAPSNLHGYGLFCTSKLRQGLALSFDYKNIEAWSKHQLMDGRGFSYEKLEEFKRYMWYDPSRRLYCLDTEQSYMRFINHANPPEANIGYSLDYNGLLCFRTLKEIEVGMELLTNYGELFPGEPAVWEAIDCNSMDTPTMLYIQKNVTHSYPEGKIW